MITMSEVYVLSASLSLLSCIVNYGVSNLPINQYALQLFAATAGKHLNVMYISVAAITTMK